MIIKNDYNGGFIIKGNRNFFSFIFRLIEEEEQLRREMTEQKERKLREEDLKQFEDNKKRREDIQRKQIQEALNQQTLPHFKAYSEQQHPQNIQAVCILIIIQIIKSNIY